MKKLLVISAFLLAVGTMPAPDGPMDPYPGYWNGRILREPSPILIGKKIPKQLTNHHRSRAHAARIQAQGSAKESLAQRVCQLYSNKVKKNNDDSHNVVLKHNCKKGILTVYPMSVISYPYPERIPTRIKSLGKVIFNFTKLSQNRLKNLLSSTTTQLVYENGSLHLKKEAPKKSSKHVDSNFSQELCKLMNNSKNFKSMGMEKCSDCACHNGTLVCKCMHRQPGPVVRSTKQDRFLDFNNPENHPVVVVPEEGYTLQMQNLKDFLKNKLFKQYEVKIDPMPKIYREVK